MDLQSVLISMLAGGGRRGGFSGGGNLAGNPLGSVLEGMFSDDDDRRDSYRRQSRRGRSRSGGGILGNVAGRLLGNVAETGLKAGGTVLIAALASRLFDRMQGGQPDPQASQPYGGWSLGGGYGMPGGTQAPSELTPPPFPGAAQAQAAGYQMEHMDPVQAEFRALILIRAMIAACHADGVVDQQEIQRILGHLADDGLSEEETQFIQQELAKPLSLEQLIAEAGSDRQLAQQIYTAAAAAITVDTAAEAEWLQRLAAGLGLTPPPAPPPFPAGAPG